MAIELKPVLAEIRLSIDTDSDDDIDGALSQHRSMNFDQVRNYCTVIICVKSGMHAVCTGA